MFELTVKSTFCAAHSISIGGTAEPLHGHNWHVTVTVRAEQLDPDGLVCDFHTVHDKLREAIDSFDNNNLNEIPPFNAVNPTAELVAKHIADSLTASLGDGLAPYARIAAVRVTESEGCSATYFPPETPVN